MFGSHFYALSFVILIAGSYGPIGGPCDNSRALLGAASVDASAPSLNISELVIVYSTTLERLSLVLATRPSRRGVRTVVVVPGAPGDAAALAAQHSAAEHSETFLAWSPGPRPSAGSSTQQAQARGRALRQGGAAASAAGGGALHPLHSHGPQWALSPLLAHAALVGAATRPASTASTAAAAAAAASAAAAPPPPARPYRWLLLGRDDTLWRPAAAAALLAPFNASRAAAVTDHLLDFNGRQLLAPSPVPAVCLPCHANLTALLGRRRPPRVPPPGCPVCRPPAGCEFRLDACRGLAGGACGSKRFLGSGDRCGTSWPAGGAGVALSVRLLEHLQPERWEACVGDSQPSTGERSLARCLWRGGIAFTHPAAGLAAHATRAVFSGRHLVFGSPLARRALLAGLAPGARAALEAAGAVGGGGGGGSNQTAVVPSSTREVAAGGAEAAAEGAGEGGGGACDAACEGWAARHAVSVHLDVPHGLDGGALRAAAAAAAAVEVR